MRNGLAVRYEVVTAYGHTTGSVRTNLRINEVADLIATESARLGRPSVQVHDEVTEFVFSDSTSIKVPVLTADQIRGAYRQGRCPRCSGTGMTEAYVHVEAGICFRCLATGVRPVSGTEGSKGVFKAGREVVTRRDILEALKAA